MEEKKKLALDVEALEVDSFRTSGGGEDERGTVRANGVDADADAAPAGRCTCGGTCLCPTAYYYCGTGPESIYSCDYTMNRSCVHAA